MSEVPEPIWVGPEEREAEYQRRCRSRGADPEQLRAAWQAGLDPDAGYDQASPWFGTDVAGLTMLLDLPAADADG